MKCGSGKRTRSSTNGPRRARVRASQKISVTKTPICSVPSAQAVTPAPPSSCRMPTRRRCASTLKRSAVPSRRRTRHGHSRPSWLAHHAQTQGAEKPHHGAAATSVPGTQRSREYLAIPAPDLPLKPGVQELHRHSRRLPGRLAKAARRDRANRINRYPRVGNHRSNNMKAGITAHRLGIARETVRQFGGLGRHGQSSVTPPAGQRSARADDAPSRRQESSARSCRSARTGAASRR